MSTPPSRLRVLALASYPVEAASSRYRMVQFVSRLDQLGIDISFMPLLNACLFADLYRPGAFLRRLPQLGLRTLLLAREALLSQADVVLVQREAMLFGPPVIEWFATSAQRKPLVLDLDDATYIPYVSPVYGRLASLLKWPSKTDWLIRRARIVTCGNPTIAAYVRSRGTEARVLPTVLDTNVFRPATATHPGIPTIGWMGSHSTYPYLERILPIFERLGRELPFRLTIVGSGRREVVVPGVSVETRPWRMEHEADDLRSFDIGVYPISDDAWSAGKSGFKAVQYMSLGIPFVMSPVGVCATMGAAGETHLQAITDEEWLHALRRLIADAGVRAQMGAAGRAFAEKHYSIDQQAEALAAVLRAAVR